MTDYFELLKTKRSIRDYEDKQGHDSEAPPERLVRINYLEAWHQAAPKIDGS